MLELRAGLWNPQFFRRTAPRAFFRRTFCLAGEMAGNRYTGFGLFFDLAGYNLPRLLQTGRLAERPGSTHDLPESDPFPGIGILK